MKSTYPDKFGSLIFKRQDRVTDHRLGLSVKNLENIMEGDGIEQIIDQLVRKDQESRLEEALVDSTL
jgi:peptide chain release factor 1